MSTPPLPTPQSALPEQPVEPGLSEPARIINIFVAPSQTFADVRRNPSWFSPWLLSAIISLILAFVSVQKLDLGQIVRQAMERSPIAQKRLEQATPEQREKGIALQTTIAKVTFFTSPLLFLIGGIIIGAVLLGVFNFGFGAEVSFRQALAVTFYGLLPGIVSAILVIVAILVSSDPNSLDFASGNPIATSPAFFMDANGNKFLYSLASGIDIIRIWQIILLGLGFAIVSSSGRRKLAASTAITTIFVIYFVLVLGRAAIAAAF